MNSAARPLPTGRSMQIVWLGPNVDLDAIVPRQRLRNDFLLHLAVETDRYLPLVVALAQRDERILLRELLERRRVTA